MRTASKILKSIHAIGSFTSGLFALHLAIEIVISSINVHLP